MLSIFILENTGYSLTFETSHFPNGSIHHGQLVSGEREPSNSFTPPKIPSEFKGFVPVPGFCFGQPYTFMSHLNLSLTTEVLVNLTPAPLRCGSSHICCRTCHTHRRSPLSCECVCPPTVTRHVNKSFSLGKCTMLVSQLEIRVRIELFVGARTAESSTLFKYAMGFSASTPLFRATFQFLAGVTHKKSHLSSSIHLYFFLSFGGIALLTFTL